MAIEVTGISGRRGRLRAGSRPLTELMGWEAEPTNRTEGVWRLAVREHQPHPLHWQTVAEGDACRVTLETVGGSYGGQATLLSVDPPILEIREMERE
jgi:hypothetical protein